MSKIQLFIAQSLDGYIARKDNSLDWLYALENPNNLDHGYYAFLEGIDTVILGRKTYEEILSFGVEWPYSECKSYVVTTDKNYLTKTENTFVLNGITDEVIAQLKAESHKNIWIVGGSIIIQKFLELSQIDEMILTIIPILIGDGIKLFPEGTKESWYSLVQSEAFATGAINLTYKRKSK